MEVQGMGWTGSSFCCLVDSVAAVSYLCCRNNHHEWYCYSEGIVGKRLIYELKTKKWGKISTLPAMKVNVIWNVIRNSLGGINNITRTIPKKIMNDKTIFKNVETHKKLWYQYMSIKLSNHNEMQIELERSFQREYYKSFDSTILFEQNDVALTAQPACWLFYFRILVWCFCMKWFCNLRKNFMYCVFCISHLTTKIRARCAI
jgi:hypothetical protein